jgi:hypothetical protein
VEEELNTESIPQPTLVDEGETFTKPKSESSGGSMEDLMKDMGDSVSSLLEDLQ